MCTKETNKSAEEVCSSHNPKKTIARRARDAHYWWAAHHPSSIMRKE
jgi:hypothetical protein